MIEKSHMRVLIEVKINKIVAGINRDMRISEGWPLDKPLPHNLKDIDVLSVLETATDEQVLLMLISMMRPWQKAEL